MKMWGVSFHTIEAEWTDSQFFAMTERLGERLEEGKEKTNTSQSVASSGARGERPAPVQTRPVSTENFLSLAKTR